ncbi:MAG: hypothetical protein GX801_05810 [Fibrobacter sp.]|nr:hypothetical protein [Fibrobacter sp.]
MKKFLTIALLLIAYTTTFAQNPNKPISVQEKFAGYALYQDGKLLNTKQIDELMATNQEAHKLFKSSKNTNIVTTIFSYTGGFAIGYSLGYALTSGDGLMLELIGIGAVCIAIAIPISKSAQKKGLAAVDAYNQGLEKKSFLEKTEVYLQTSGNNLALSINF